MVVNKYVVFIFFCICRLGLCRRRPGYYPSGSSGSGDPVAAAIVAAFILVPITGGWVSYAIACKLTKRPETVAWLENTTTPRWFRIPDGFYALIWMLLYALMGIAAYIVYENCHGFTVEAALPLSLYGGQLLLNWTWSPVFYSFRKLSLGFFYFVALDAVTVACSAIFFFNDPVAFYLLLPYQVFLAYLTCGACVIWKMNPIDNNISTLKNETKF